MFELRLLGTVEVTRAGKLVRGFESRKAVALLGYLAARRQAISRSLLADLFWGDKPEPQGRANLSRVLHNLTTLLPHCLMADPQTVEFQLPANCWLDLAAFDEFVKPNTPAALARAAVLYRDEFMAGLYLDDCPDFEIWLVAERERWRQRVSEALRALVTHHLNGNEVDAAIHFASLLLSLEPWREEAHRQMMLLLVRSGQRSAALVQYDTCRRVLAEELNVEPSPETTALYERIRKQEIGAEPETVRPAASTALLKPQFQNLPLLFTSFIGRDKEVAEIADRLSNPACRLLTLVGAAGIGKTRLAVEAAGRLDSFPDGIYFVPFAAVSSTEFVVAAMASTLEFSFEGVEEQKAQLLNYLREKQLLLVLDSFEHLAEASVLLNEILQNAPNVKLLVTSQQRLNLRAEWLITVEGLAFPRLSETQPLAEFAAVQLFLERARSMEARFTLSAESQAAVIRICQLVEGMPLGLELAAAWVGKLSCAYIAGEIEHNLDFLTSTLNDVPARHRSLRAAIEWSYNLLDEDTRTLLRRLSVFAGGFTVHAARTVCDRPESQREILNRLGALVDKSLLRAHPGLNGSPRFTMLEPIHEYARERLVESGELELIRERHANWFLSIIEAADPKLVGVERASSLLEMEKDYANLRAALEWSLGAAGQAHTALRLVAALRWYWYFQSLLNEGREWAERALKQSAKLPPSSALAKTLYSAGAGAWLQGDYDAAQVYLRSSTEVARQLGDRESLAFGLTLLGLVRLNQGDGAAAVALQAESGALFRELDDRWGLAVSLTNMQLAASMQGDDASVRRALEQAIALFRELHELWGLSLALNNLGLLAYRQGNYKTARARLAEALTIRREVGDKWLIAQSLNYLGNVARAEGDGVAARAWFDESLKLNRELGNKHGLTETLEGFAQLAAGQQQPLRAARLFGAAEALRQAIGSPMPVEDREEYEQRVDATRAKLSAKAFTAAWGEGAAMRVEQTIEYALRSAD